MSAEFSKHYRDKGKKKLIIMIALLITTIVGLFLALGIGIYNISFVDSIIVFFDHLTGDITDPKGDHYIWEGRLPRALAAIFAGASMAIAGAIMQNATNNPLAEPYTMGISSAALLGASFSLALNFSIIPGLPTNVATIVNAFIMALIPVAVILIYSKFRKMSSVAIILMGIALMYMFSSISQYLMVTCSPETLSEIYDWRVGSLGKFEESYDKLAIVIAITVPISIVLMALSSKLDLMYTGDNNALTMGLDLKRFRVLVMSLVSLSTAAIVSFTGTIGFIGLVGPHIARALVGSKNRYLLPCSAIFGATFLVLADTIAKVSGPGGLPVGVISSMVGGPLFLYILIKHNKKVWH